MFPSNKSYTTQSLPVEKIEENNNAKTEIAKNFLFNCFSLSSIIIEIKSFIYKPPKKYLKNSIYEVEQLYLQTLQIFCLLVKLAQVCEQ